MSQNNKAGFIVGMIGGFITVCLFAFIAWFYFFLAGIKTDIEALQIEAKVLDMTMRQVQPLDRVYIGTLEQMTSPAFKDAKNLQPERKQPLPAKEQVTTIPAITPPTQPTIKK